MNWLTDFFYRDPDDAEAPVRPARPARPARPGQTEKRNRFETFRHGLKIRRVRAKSAFRKLSKKHRKAALLAIVCALGAVVFAGVLLSLNDKLPRRENTLTSIFPAPSAPALPILEDESLATDPAAAPRRWRYIVVHHSGGTSGSAQAFDTYHREIKGWHSLGYHFVIGNGKGQGDGKVEPGPRWYAQQAGAHAHSAEHNEFEIGICLVGNFDAQNPTPAQWHSLVSLVKRLSARYNIQPGNIVGHSQIRQGGSTACPGKNLNVQALREAVMGE